jgi:AcrR family transcriptional regulator
MSEDRGSSTANDEREQRILDAAEELVVHYGYDKTTVSDIAREAGVSKGAIYLHYASKDELFDALIVREIQRYVDHWLELVEPDPEAGTFAGMYRHALSLVADMPLMRALLRQDRRVFGNYMRRDNNLAFRQRREFQEHFMRAMQEAGALRADIDPGVTSYLLSMLFIGFLGIEEFVSSEDAPPLEDLLNAMANMMDRWLGPISEEGKVAGKQVLMQMVQVYREHMAGMYKG